MYVKSFSIKNFRSLKSFRIDQFGKTTVFNGDNNVGKSSVLYALHSLFKRKRQYNDDLSGLLPELKNFYVGVLEDFKHDFYQNSKEDIEFFVEFEVSRAEIKINDSFLLDILNLREMPINFDVNFTGSINRSSINENYGEILFSEIKINDVPIYLNIEGGLTYFPSKRNDKLNIDSLVKTFEEFIEPFNDCILLVPSSRDMLSVNYKYKDSIKSEQLNSTNYKQFLYQLYLNIDTNFIFQAINKQLLASPFIFGEISFAKIGDELEIMIEYNNVRLPIKYLGTGVMQILFILTLVSCSKSKIICVEELEQNLSPPNQNLALRKLQSFFDSGEIINISQIIFSTHSRVFENSKLCDVIYKLTKEGNETIIEDFIDTKKAESKPNPKTIQFWSGRISKKSSDQKTQEKYYY